MKWIIGIVGMLGIVYIAGGVALSSRHSAVFFACVVFGYWVLGGSRASRGLMHCDTLFEVL